VRRQSLRVALLAGLVQLAGCADGNASWTDKDGPTATLSNVSGIHDTSVGVYGEIDAEVFKTTEEAYVVRVRMSYSYSYDCDGDAGAVYGTTTEVVDEVTEVNVTLRAPEEDVKTVC